MNSVLYPISCARTPSQRRWLWSLSSSATSVRVHCPLGEVRRVGVAADPADPLDQVQRLRELATLCALLDAAVVVAHVEVKAHDSLSVDEHAKAHRLLEGRMLRADREFNLGHSFPPCLGASSPCVRGTRPPATPRRGAGGAGPDGPRTRSRRGRGPRAHIGSRRGTPP